MGGRFLISEVPLYRRVRGALQTYRAYSRIRSYKVRSPTVNRDDLGTKNGSSQGQNMSLTVVFEPNSINSERWGGLIQ